MALLEIKNCSVSFGGLKAVQDFSLDIGELEIVGLIGPNGSGKTTVFNMITGIYPPGDGEVIFRGKAIQQLAPHVVSRLGIARTFQNTRLFGDLTVVDNIRAAFQSRARSGLLKTALRSPGFIREEDSIMKKSLDILESMGLVRYALQISRNLPYGEQRRLEIARAIATEPRLILLDEPAAGMNPVEKKKLMELIEWIHKGLGITVLIIEHDMSVIMGICERIRVMDHGLSIAEGSPEMIQKDPKVIEAYLGGDEGEQKETRENG